jgi:DNA-binding transcriptional LysR family regulator
MPDLRDMQLLAALAHNRHFARAAAECGISQPAFSERIRNLELDLGAPIVKRGNRFLGFTEEGEIALKWAYRMIADAQGLRQEIEQARGALSGQLTLGAVPTALSFTAKVAAQLHHDHPGLVVQIFSRSSVEISQGLEDFSLDAGVTYQESRLPAASNAEHLYDEHYVLLVPEGLAPGASGTITWAEAAEFPLCLLTKNMMNRKIVEEAFAAAGAKPNLVIETNALTAALAQLASGSTATITPENLAEDAGLRDGVLRLKLSDPIVAKPICAVTPDREPMLPSVAALLDCMREMARQIAR